MKIFFVFFIFLFNFEVKADDLSYANFANGLKTSFSYLYHGSFLQFKEKNNLYYVAAGVPTLWYAFDQDKRISTNAREKKIPRITQLASDLAPALGFPIISFATYSLGTKHDDPRMIQFAQEYFASMYLAFIESAVMSVVPIHERPSSEKLSKWETNLRGKSSFPSGHVIPYATLALKTFQFYGPAFALAPSALLVLTSIQRVRDGKHYLSDVLGGFFLSAFASEGVRKAGQFSGNHPTYKYLFERNVAIGVFEFENTIGPRITFDW